MPYMSESVEVKSLGSPGFTLKTWGSRSSKLSLLPKSFGMYVKITRRGVTGFWSDCTRQEVWSALDVATVCGGPHFSSRAYQDLTLSKPRHRVSRKSPLYQQSASFPSVSPVVLTFRASTCGCVNLKRILPTHITKATLSCSTPHNQAA